MHFMAAGFFGIPELLLDDDEAAKLGASTERVMALYETEINPAALAWLSLLFTIVCVYGPRFYVIRKRWMEENAAAQTGAVPSPVVPIDRKPAPEPAPARSAAPAETEARPTGTPTDLFGEGYSAALPEAL